MASNSFGKHVGTPWKLLEAVVGLAGKHLGAIWEASGSSLEAPGGNPGAQRPQGPGEQGHVEKVAHLSAKMQKLFFFSSFC